mgnify:CR=1 FL=1|jgi:signal transduction histidine kinase
MKFSIRDKLIFSYTLLVGISFLIMIFFINKSILRNNENIILNDLSRIDKNVKIYTEQYLIINDIKDMNSEFTKIHKNFLEDLNQKLVERGVLYFDGGKIANDTHNMDIYSERSEALQLALKRKSSCSIYFNGEYVTADFSIPIIYKNKLIGVYRFLKDYTKLYQSGYFIIRSISIFALITGFGIIVISLIISSKMLKPLSKLRDYSIRMADGDFDIEVDIKSKDEIGDLAQQFTKMRHQIHSQIKAILISHEKLSRIENYRKQFFDNVTHELKTPLTIISGFAQMIEDTDYSDRELLQRGISYIQDESQRLQRLVQKLLDISRHNLGNTGDTFKILCISDLIASVCEEMEVKAKRHEVTIYRDIEYNMYVNGNHDDLKSVFINLIDNAIKYSFESTCIEVTAHKAEGQIKIIAKDYGRGIPENLLDKVFEPFFRDKVNLKTEEGTGLGLFITKQIIDNHNGVIFITNIEHQGTCVHVHIPAES